MKQTADVQQQQQQSTNKKREDRPLEELDGGSVDCGGGFGYNSFVLDDDDSAVSYTHLTLPTIYSV